MITYESICKKLGFDPLTVDPKTLYPPRKDPFMVDDSVPSPFAVLTYEESKFLDPIMDAEYERRKKAKLRDVQN